MSLLNAVLQFATICLVVVNGARYEFMVENDEIFENCPEIPDNNGVHDVGDFSDATIIYSDGKLRCSGNVTCVWEGVQPTDRIQGRAEVYKRQRGSWQPTPFTIVVDDICKRQFEENAIWYQVWSSHIYENDRECLNNIGHVYHHMPFDVDTVFDFAFNMEGEYKIVAHLEAIDENDTKRPKTICFQIPGEFIKVK